MGCLDDIAKVVDQSASMNHPQLVGDQQGDVIVPVYDWISFFKERTIKNGLRGIKKMAHFRFSSDSPGHVYVKETIDGVERQIKLLKDTSWRLEASSLHSRGVTTDTSVVPL